VLRGWCEGGYTKRGSYPAYVFKPQQKTLESISLAFCDDLAALEPT